MEMLLCVFHYSLTVSPLFQSDMYSLGVILLELFQPFGTEMERAHVLTGLRTGQIPESLSKRCPVQAKYIQHLTRKNSSQRPSAVQLLQSELFQNSGNVCMIFLILGEIWSLKWNLFKLWIPFHEEQLSLESGLWKQNISTHSQSCQWHTCQVS